jgi:hypothetical protein
MTDETTRSAFDADETEALRAIGWERRAGEPQCPDSSLLTAAEEGVLDEASSASVRAHVATCASCQLLAKDLAAVFAEAPDRAAAARIRSRIHAGITSRRPAGYLWWGTAMAAAAGLVWFLTVPRPRAVLVPVPQGAQLTPAATPSVFVVGRPMIPPGDVDLTVRGDAAASVSLEDQIGAALDEADRGSVMAAASELLTIANQHPTSRIAFLALGAVQLRAGQSAEAVTTLTRARTQTGDEAAADEAGWFLGIALVRTGHTDGARAILDEVCRHRGARGPVACAGVAEIDRNTSSR